MQYIEKTDKSVDEVVKTMQEKIAEYKFGIMHIHEIQNTLKSKGLEFDKECKVLDVCSPGYAKKLLDADMKFSVIMPCKIAVYNEDNQTYISMNSVVQLIDDVNPDFIEVGQEVQEILQEFISACK